MLVLPGKLLLQPVQTWDGAAGNRTFPSELVERLAVDAHSHQREGVFVAQATEDRVDVFLVPYDKLPAIDTESDGLMSSAGEVDTAIRRTGAPPEGTPPGGPVDREAAERDER